MTSSFAPVDTNARLSDVPPPADSAMPAAAAAPETVVVYRDAPAPTAAKPKPKPGAPAPNPSVSTPAEVAAPAAPARRQLAEGTVIAATTTDSISSKFDSAGKLVKVRVADDVKDAEGHTVIPAGSMVTLKIVTIKWSENKKDKGTLKMSTQNVLVDGKRLPLVGSVSTPEFTYKHRGSFRR